MSDLSKLPNVGKVLEKLLVEARSLAVLISDGKKNPPKQVKYLLTVRSK